MTRGKTKKFNLKQAMGEWKQANPDESLDESKVVLGQLSTKSEIRLGVAREILSHFPATKQGIRVLTLTQGTLLEYMLLDLSQQRRVNIKQLVAIKTSTNSVDTMGLRHLSAQFRTKQLSVVRGKEAQLFLKGHYPGGLSAARGFEAGFDFVWLDFEKPFGESIRSALQPIAQNPKRFFRKALANTTQSGLLFISCSLGDEKTIHQASLNALTATWNEITAKTPLRRDTGLGAWLNARLESKGARVLPLGHMAYQEFPPSRGAKALKPTLKFLARFKVVPCDVNGA